MSSFNDLEPDFKTLCIVGMFMQAWAIMEHSLNDVIGRLLNLDTSKTAVVTKNIQLRDKIKIVTTTINMAYFSSDDKKVKYLNLIANIAKMSSIRNMTAHDLFYPVDNGGAVGFNVTKAHTRLEFPDTKITNKEFFEHIDSLHTYTEELQQLHELLNETSAFEAIVKALMQSDPSYLEGDERASPDTPNHQPRLSRDSSRFPATDQTNE